MSEPRRPGQELPAAEAAEAAALEQMSQPASPPVPEHQEMAAALQALAIEPEVPAAVYRAVVTALDWAAQLDARVR